MSQKKNWFLNFSNTHKNSQMKSKKPYNWWAREQSNSNSTKNSFRTSMNQKKCSIMSKNSTSGSTRSAQPLTMILKLKKMTKMQVQALNWSTGEAECRKSPTGLNNWNQKTFKLWRSTCSATSNMIANVPEAMKRFLSSWWNTIDWIYY